MGKTATRHAARNAVCGRGVKDKTGCCDRCRNGPHRNHSAQKTLTRSRPHTRGIRATGRGRAAVCPPSGLDHRGPPPAKDEVQFNASSTGT